MIAGVDRQTSAVGCKKKTDRWRRWLDFGFGSARFLRVDLHDSTTQDHIPHTVLFLDADNDLCPGSDIVLRKVPFARIHPALPLLPTSTSHY